MTLLTYIHAVAVLLTLLKKSFGCKALLPQTASQANFSFHLLKKIIYLRLRTQVTSFYLLHMIIVFNTHFLICIDHKMIMGQIVTDIASEVRRKFHFVEL